MMEANIGTKHAASSKTGDHSSAWGIGALAGIVLGLIALFTGLLLWATSYVEQIDFHGMDSLLLGLSFILLMAGSHFLDAARKDLNKKKKKNLNL
jgi:hypothetical protein